MRTWTRKVNRVGRPCRRMSLIALVIISQSSVAGRVRAESPRIAGNVHLPAGEALDRHGDAGVLGRGAETGERTVADGPARSLVRSPEVLPGPDVLGPGRSEGAPVDQPDGERTQVAVETPPAGDRAEADSGLILHRAPPPGTSAPNGVVGQGGRLRESGGPSWRHMAPLLLVLGLIGLIAYVIRRCTPVRRMLTGAGVVDVVARTPISTKQSLVLVRMGQRLVLVGVCPDRLSALAEVDDPDEVAAVLGQAAGRQAGSIRQQFAEAFGEQVGAYADGPEEEAAPPGGHVRCLLEKVRALAQGRSVA